MVPGIVIVTVSMLGTSVGVDTVGLLEGLATVVVDVADVSVIVVVS